MAEPNIDPDFPSPSPNPYPLDNSSYFTSKTSGHTTTGGRIYTGGVGHGEFALWLKGCAILVSSVVGDSQPAQPQTWLALSREGNLLGHPQDQAPLCEDPT